MWKKLNEEGCIPAGQECPFKIQCTGDQDDFCFHAGKNHEVDFSCALSRAYDLLLKDEKQENVSANKSDN